MHPGVAGAGGVPGAFTALNGYSPSAAKAVLSEARSVENVVGERWMLFK